MDKKQARKELQTLRDSITKVLGEKSHEDISEHIQEAQESAREGAKALKKSLIERIKDLPVVTQVSQLGAAGTVAVSTAAVTQVDIAKDRTEIFVAEVAQDVIDERFEVPQFIDNFVDFASLNDWGQGVIAEKIQEAQDFVAEASEPQQTSTPSAESSDTTPETSSSSQDSSSDNASQPSETEEPQEPKSEESESKEGKSSSEPTEEPKEVKSNDEPQEESKSDTEQSEAKSDAIPIVETPIDSFDDDIKPHSQVRQVSPTQ
jgi:outer membrane biosynthesis protein TonB